MPCVVAFARALDLDDVGAEIGEQLPGPGAGENAGEFEDAYAGEWFGHFGSVSGIGELFLGRGILARLPRQEAIVSDKIKVGDRVAWRSSGGRSVGKVLKKQTTRAKIRRHEVAASKDNPEYIVESDKSGGRAAHRASALSEAPRGRR